MDKSNHTFSLNELALLTDIPRRTVRYYIQNELLDRPDGRGRGSHYTGHHLEQLIEIRRLQKSGVSLARIRQIMAEDDIESPPPTKPQEIGSVEVRSHVKIADGVELSIDPKRCGLSAASVRTFADGLVYLYEQIKKEGK